MVQRSLNNFRHSTRTFNFDKDYKQINEQKMTYTTEEIELIENAAKEYADEICAEKDTLGKCFAVDDFMSVYKSKTMQQIIESRIKQAKIELLDELDEETPNFIKGFIDDKLTELKK